MMKNYDELLEINHNPSWPYRPSNIGARYHPERDKFSLLFLGWYIIRKFEKLR